MRSVLLGPDEARQTIGLTRAEHALVFPKDRMPSFLPFQVALLKGEEAPSIWWAGNESSLLTAPLSEGFFGIYENEFAREVCDVSEGIIQLQRQQNLIVGTPDVMRYKELLANTYRNVFVKNDRVPDVSQHLQIVSIGVVSRDPSGDHYRACVRARKLHCKNRDSATVVLDFSLQTLQDLLDAVSSQNGPLLARGADTNRSGLICRPDILRADL